MKGGGIFRGSRRQRGGRIKRKHKQRGGIFRGSRRQKGGQKKLQRGGFPPALIPLLVAGITAAGGIASSATHAAISK